MPVTARLSKLFYDRLGEEIADELVNWFNLVDATYRADLRELNELNFARFDAKLEQRLAELDGKWGSRSAALDAKLEQRTAELRQEIAQYTAAMRAELHALRGEMATGFERVRADSANQRADLLKWMFLFWAPTALALIGLYAKS